MNAMEKKTMIGTNGPKEGKRREWTIRRALAACCLASAVAAACDGGGSPVTLGPPGRNAGQGPIVKFDLFGLPLPEVPLPNDIATRPDPNSPTGRRLNAAVIVAPTELEREARRKIDKLDGWGVYGAVSVGFTHEDKAQARLDVLDIRRLHAGDDFDFRDDAVYVINVEPSCRGRRSESECADYGKPVAIELGEGNFPIVLQDPDRYYENDPRGTTSNILFETIEEDVNPRDGVLQPEEDTDFDGILDHPNLYPGGTDDAADLLTFYEYQTETLIMRPMIPLRERTRYAVVLTTRLRGVNGHPVRSPFPYFHHVDQAADLADLGSILGQSEYYGEGMGLDQVAFAWTFTTQSVRQDIIEMTNGLYGRGVFARLAAEFPREMYVNRLWECNPSYPGSCIGENALPANLYAVTVEELMPILSDVAEEAFGVSADELEPLLRTYQYAKHFVFGWVTSPQFLDNDGDGWEEEAWDVNWRTGRGKHTPGRVNFVAVVPKDEYRISYNRQNGRPDDAPAPVVFYGHGYTGFRIEGLGFAGSLAKYGLATVTWDAVHHGTGMDATLRDVATGIFSVQNLHAAGHALLDDRAVDLDNDKYDGRGSDESDLLPPPCGRRPCIPTMHFDVPFSGRQRLDFEDHLPGGDIRNDRPNAWLGRWEAGDPGRWTPNVMYQDDQEDSAGDFWTAYVFHTRDVVRQSALDLIRIIHVMEGFDGTRPASFDVDGDGDTDQYDFDADGTPDLAGDFDGDTLVDLGGPGNDYYVWGQSLGGIMSGVLGGTHPSIHAVAPVAGGGGLGDVGVRSTQGGVKEAVILRIMGPLVVTVPANTRYDTRPDRNRTACCEASTCDPSIVSLRFIVPQQNNTGEIEIACLNRGASEFTIAPRDVVVLRNMNRPGEARCAVADAERRTRLSIPSDLHDPLEITIYDGSGAAGWPLQEGAPNCRVAAGVTPRSVTRGTGAGARDVFRIETFEVPRQTFEWHAFEQGAPLVAVAEGYGLRRGMPEFRRFLGLAQMILDPADPAVYAPHYRNSMVVNTVGDMNVPVSTGIAIARTAGILRFDRDAVNPAWEDIGVEGVPRRPGGRTPNRVLVDTHVLMGLERLVPWRGTAPEGALFDADDFAQGTDGFGQPRLRPALRAWRSSRPGEACSVIPDAYGAPLRVECPGGVSSLVLPYISPGGEHGFELPDPDLAFDVNTYMVNMIGRYFGTRARVMEYALCMHDNSCSWIPPLPFGPDWP